MLHAARSVHMSRSSKRPSEHPCCMAACGQHRPQPSVSRACKPCSPLTKGMRTMGMCRDLHLALRQSRLPSVLRKALQGCALRCQRRRRSSASPSSGIAQALLHPGNPAGEPSWQPTRQLQAGLTAARSRLSCRSCRAAGPCEVVCFLRRSAKQLGRSTTRRNTKTSDDTLTWASVANHLS